MSGDKGAGKIVPFPFKPHGGLAGGGDGPHDPDMETRLRRLEDSIPRIEALMTRMDDRLRVMETDIGEMKGRTAPLLTLGDKVDRLGDKVDKLAIDVAEVKGRVTHLPSTWAMITTMLGGQIALAGLLATILRLLPPH